MYTLNETPVRTSKNYGINNIKIDLNLDVVNQDINKNREFNNVSFETEELDRIKVNIQEKRDKFISKI